MTEDELITAINTLKPTSEEHFDGVTVYGGYCVPTQLIADFEQFIQSMPIVDYTKLVVRMTNICERPQLSAFNRAVSNGPVFVARMKDLHAWKQTATDAEKAEVFGHPKSDLALLQDAEASLRGALKYLKEGVPEVAASFARSAAELASQFVTRHEPSSQEEEEDFESCKHCGEPLKKVRCGLCGEVCD